MLKSILLAVLALAAARGENYCFGFLKAHPDRREIPKEQADEIQAGHMAHIRRMGAAGHLLAAGPILTPGGLRGIVIYRCESLDAANEWASLDPAVQNKRLVVEMYRWVGPDGIGEPLATRLKENPDAKVNMSELPLVVLRPTGKWTSQPPADLFAEHLRHNREMLKDGKLRAAGPFVDAEGKVGTVPGKIGLYVFKTMLIEEAKSLIGQDAFVREGYASIDTYTWLVADDVLPKL